MSLKQTLKRRLFGLLGKDPEAVVLSFRSGDEARARAMVAEFRRLAPDRRHFEIGPLERIAEEHQLMMYHHTGFWHCMDNVRDMNALNQMWDQAERPWVIWE